jgi:hypothetical protein
VVFVDKFSKMAHYVPTREQDLTPDVVAHIVNQIHIIEARYHT